MNDGPQHTDWLEAEIDGEETRERYQYFMRPEPLDRELGPIQEEQDPRFPGGVARFREAWVGMTRNAAKEDKRRLKVYLDPLPHIRIPNGKDLQGWYQAKDLPTGEKVGGRPRPCMTDAILTEPYGGYCTVGCSFCYINAGMRGYRGSGLISVPDDYGGHVRKQLAKCKTATAGYFSSFTDPFLPLEAIYHNTQRGAEAFHELGLPVFFLSRLHYPGWAYDLLAQNKYSYAQKSINTANPDTWARYSPGAISLADHCAEIRELRRRGIYVSIQCNPILPGIVTHEGVRELFEMLADAGANHVIVKFVEAGYSWAPAMVERQRRRFGKDDPRVQEFERLFTDNIGGQRTVDEAYRLEGHHLYRLWATARGMTYATCYEYRYERDAAGKITSKRGVSVGREFLTGDQCHGHRVPMFTRAELDQPFREVEECPPSGCLDCASPEGKVPCGSTLYGSAPALRLADLKRGVYGS